MQSSSEHSTFHRYVNPRTPLGPFAADRIEHDEVAARLFDPHNTSFNKLLSRDIDIIVGRRGSGKTALLNCYRYKKFLSKSLPKPLVGNTDLADYDIVFSVSSHTFFEKMQNFVMGPNNVFRPIESVVDEWRHLLGDLAIVEVIKSIEKITAELQPVLNYLDGPEATKRSQALEIVWGKGVFKRGHPPATYPTQREVLTILEGYLKSRGQKFVLLFDSMDEYMVGERVVDRTVGALLRHVRDFNSRYDRLKMKLSLPSEVFPEIKRASANPLRDMIKFDHVFWTATELLQVAAHQFRRFLEFNDSDTFEQCAELDFNRGKDLRKFWGSLFKNPVTNKYGAVEETLIYILRHTQLLPRQFLVILDRLIVESHTQTGGYRELKSELAIWAVEKHEESVATEIFTAYYYIYPSVEQIGRSMFGNFSPVFSYDELEHKWKTVGRPMDYRSEGGHHAFGDVIEMFLRVGIIGVCGQETEKYIEGAFSYNQLAPPNLGSGKQLCVHPIFSKHFNCADAKSRKAILPSGVTSSPLSYSPHLPQ